MKALQLLCCQKRCHPAPAARLTHGGLGEPSCHRSEVRGDAAFPPATLAPHLNKADLAKQKAHLSDVPSPQTLRSSAHGGSHQLVVPLTERRNKPLLLSLLTDYKHRVTLFARQWDPCAETLSASQAPVTLAGTVTKTVLYPDKSYAHNSGFDR